MQADFSCRFQSAILYCFTIWWAKISYRVPAGELSGSLLRGYPPRVKLTVANHLHLMSLCYQLSCYQLFWYYNNILYQPRWLINLIGFYCLKELPVICQARTVHLKHTGLLVLTASHTFEQISSCYFAHFIATVFIYGSVWFSSGPVWVVSFMPLLLVFIAEETLCKKAQRKTREEYLSPQKEETWI